jgi:hypothetical protein
MHPHSDNGSPPCPGPLPQVPQLHCLGAQAARLNFFGPQPLLFAVSLPKGLCSCRTAYSSVRVTSLVLIRTIGPVSATAEWPVHCRKIDLSREALGVSPNIVDEGPMPLEKRQVFPNLFRYVCDSCPFDWPRTPVKESDLPPPPAHSCPSESQPDPNPVPEEPKRETKETTKPKPVAVCTRCGAVSYTVNLINGQCSQTVAGKRCIGVNGSALNPDDWNQCAACAGTGSIEGTRCGHCDGTAWLYARSKAKRQ